MEKHAWEEQTSPYQVIVEFVQEMQEWITQVTAIVREHMQTAQRDQQRVYNRPAQPQNFQPGDFVLLLLPGANCKFLTCWQAPDTICLQ